MSEASNEREKRVTADRAVMQAAGPITTSDTVSVFDINEMPETPLADTPLRIQALVNHDDAGGCSLLSVRYPPGAVVDVTPHDVAQVVLVLEGELYEGGRVLGVGGGYHTPVGESSTLVVGPEGVKVIEFRSSPLSFVTDFSVVAGTDPS